MSYRETVCERDDIEIVLFVSEVAFDGDTLTILGYSEPRYVHFFNVNENVVCILGDAEVNGCRSVHSELVNVHSKMNGVV